MPDLDSHLSLAINDEVWDVLVGCKRAAHLQCDLAELHVMLLLKVPDYDDVTVLSSRARVHLLLLEDDLNLILGKPVLGNASQKRAFTALHYDARARRIALAVTSVCDTHFKRAHATIESVHLFFEQFDNLKTLVNNDAAATILKISEIMPALREIFSRSLDLSAAGPLLPSRLAEIEPLAAELVSCGFRLQRLCDFLDASLTFYTQGIVGRGLLRRGVSPHECRIVERRAVCWAAAEAVGSIPLTESPTYEARDLFSGTLGLYLGYVVLALAALVSAFAYRLVRVVFSG